MSILLQSAPSNNAAYFRIRCLFTRSSLRLRAAATVVIPSHRATKFRRCLHLRAFHGRAVGLDFSVEATFSQITTLRVTPPRNFDEVLCSQCSFLPPSDSVWRFSYHPNPAAQAGGWSPSWDMERGKMVDCIYCHVFSWSSRLHFRQMKKFLCVGTA